MSVKPKKHLGQHFLRDKSIAARIADSLSEKSYNKVLEIGPGTGVLTEHLLKHNFETHVIELDNESVAYLYAHFPALAGKIINEDFLRWDAKQVFKDEPFAVIGNFPYNISSQIVFKVIELRQQIPEMCGMFQREVAQRITSPPGNKNYGILSVLTQAHYDVEYLFTVDENVFFPPPKVKSGVIRLTRKANFEPDCNLALFKQIVKTAFNQRRKTLRNALKSLTLPPDAIPAETLAKRAEQLHWQDFVELTRKLESHGL